MADVPVTPVQTLRPEPSSDKSGSKEAPKRQPSPVKEVPKREPEVVKPLRVIEEEDEEEEEEEEDIEEEEPPPLQKVPSRGKSEPKFEEHPIPGAKARHVKHSKDNDDRNAVVNASQPAKRETKVGKAQPISSSGSDFDLGLDDPEPPQKKPKPKSKVVNKAKKVEKPKAKSRDEIDDDDDLDLDLSDEPPAPQAKAATGRGGHAKSPAKKESSGSIEDLSLSGGKTSPKSKGKAREKSPLVKKGSTSKKLSDDSLDLDSDWT
jgi:nucleolin